MLKIKNINVEAYNYLQAIPKEHWSRSGFSTASKSAMILNNVCESFNNVLREARAKPILQCMEWIRRWIMARFVAKREGLKNFNGKLMPSVLRMIERGLKEATQLRLRQADVYEFEVDDEEYTFVVDLEEHSCTCGRWKLMGIPCWHALACIQVRRLNYEDYVHKAYYVDTYKASYAPRVKAMPGHQQWVHTDYPKPSPPPYRVMPGRPSNNKRRKEVGEDQERQEAKKAKRQQHCLRCGAVGHYQKKCNKPFGLGPPKSKGGRPKTAEPKKSNNTTNPSTSKKATNPSTSKKAPQSTNKGPKSSNNHPQSSNMASQCSNKASQSSNKAQKSSNNSGPSKQAVAAAAKKKGKKLTLLSQLQDVQASQMSTTSSAPPKFPLSQP